MTFLMKYCPFSCCFHYNACFSKSPKLAGNLRNNFLKVKEMSEPKPKKKKQGSYCCVFDCSSNTGRRGDLKFFRVQRKNEEITKAWTKAINRKNDDNSLWQPSKSSIICSRHFIAQEPSTDPISPDYIPSLNMTGCRLDDLEEQRKRKAAQALNRYDRVSNLARMPYVAVRSRCARQRFCLS